LDGSLSTYINNQSGIIGQGPTSTTTPAATAPDQTAYDNTWGSTSSSPAWQAALKALSALPQNAQGQYYIPVDANGNPIYPSGIPKAIADQLQADGLLGAAPPPSGQAVDAAGAAQFTAQSEQLGLIHQGTLAEYGADVTQAQSDLDSLTGMDNELQTRLQLESSQYTTLEQALSNIMKSFADMMQANVQNLKS
jgi:hypothetical protein